MEGKKIHLFYADPRLERAEVQEALELAWEEIKLVEYDYLYEGFRGVHLSDDGLKVFVTFQLGSGGLENAAMAVLDRKTKFVDFAPPPPEMLEKELENLERMLGVDFEELSAQELARRLRSVEDLMF